MVSLTSIFGRFHSYKALVIGDFMLDTYTIGKVERVSPEAPVTVLNVEREEERPGGAGNVALNISALGGDVVCLGRVGDDSAGEKIRALLPGDGLVVQKSMQTPVKNRIIAENQQIVRVDFERLEALDMECEEKLLKSFYRHLKEVDIVAISDYGKGMLSRSFLRKIIEGAREQKISVIIDPKGSDYTKYYGADIIKPNLKEAYLAVGAETAESLDSVAEKLLEITGSKNIIITRSQDGIALYERGQEVQNFSVVAREVIDVTGAGDTVLSVLTCAIANGMSLSDSIKIANVAAGIAIERFGCAHVDLNDIAQCLLEISSEDKIFQEHHIFALEQISQKKTITILAVHSSVGLTYDLFKNIKALSNDNSSQLILYIRDTHPEDDFISLLSSLKEVSMIVLKEEGLRSLCEHLSPKHVYLFKDKTVCLVEDWNLL